MNIRKVAVIGAGTMGAGIAGQAANAGCEVLLLDLPSENKNPNLLAQKGLNRINNPQESGLISPATAQRITVGNIRDDFHKLAEYDWIAEAILERLDLKKQLYNKLDKVCKKTSIISSNTSTIPIKLLVEDMPIDFKKRFAITHFFNPVRFMPLLELVSGEDTEPEVIAILHDFCDRRLGKGVVLCADTPGFLGNRVGCFAIQTALHMANNMGISPQEADAIFGRPMGIPKTGVFGLYDLIGIDLMSDVSSSLVSILKPTDDFHNFGAKLPIMENMIQNGQMGKKTGQGFYRLFNGSKQVINLKTGEYENIKNLNIPIAAQAEKNGIMHLFNNGDVYGEYAWKVMSRILTYAANLIPEVGDSPEAIDDAMKMGYNWIKGPFELIDEIGSDYLISRLEKEKRNIPEYLKVAKGKKYYNGLDVLTVNGDIRSIKRPEGTLRFNDMKKTLIPEGSNHDASWYNIDGLALVEFHSKANALGQESMLILEEAISAVTRFEMKGIIVHNDSQHFSCGVNLNSVRFFYNNEDWDGLDRFLKHFQQTVHKLAVAKFPTIVAPVGLSLGGGFEVVLHAKEVICHANSNMGLVESGVGLIPAGGGCKETLYRWIENKNGDVKSAAWEAFYSLGYGKTASSPINAIELAMLRDNDTYENNRDRILSSSIKSLSTQKKQKPFDRRPIKMTGKDVFDDMVNWAKDMEVKGKLCPHDVIVSTEIARILTGGDVEPGTLWTEQDLYDAERKAFLKLVKTKSTQARINSLLDDGKTLRN